MSYKESFFESCPSDPLGQEFAIAAGVPAKRSMRKTIFSKCHFETERSGVEKSGGE